MTQPRMLYVSKLFRRPLLMWPPNMFMPSGCFSKSETSDTFALGVPVIWVLLTCNFSLKLGEHGFVRPVPKHRH